MYQLFYHRCVWLASEVRHLWLMPHCVTFKLNVLITVLITKERSVRLEVKLTTHWLSPQCLWRSRRAPGAREAHGRTVSKPPWWRECPPSRSRPNPASLLRQREEEEEEGRRRSGEKSRESEDIHKWKWRYEKKRGDSELDLEQQSRCVNPTQR